MRGHVHACTCTYVCVHVCVCMCVCGSWAGPGGVAGRVGWAWAEGRSAGRQAGRAEGGEEAWDRPEIGSPGHRVGPEGAEVSKAAGLGGVTFCHGASVRLRGPDY